MLLFWWLIIYFYYKNIYIFFGLGACNMDTIPTLEVCLQTTACIFQHLITGLNNMFGFKTFSTKTKATCSNITRTNCNQIPWGPRGPIFLKSLGTCSWRKTTTRGQRRECGGCMWGGNMHLQSQSGPFNFISANKWTVSMSAYFLLIQHVSANKIVND